MVVRHARNRGPGAARNTGLDLVAGELRRSSTTMTCSRRTVLSEVSARFGDARIDLVRSNMSGRTFDGDMRRTLHHEEPPSILQTLFGNEDVARFDPTLRVSEDIDWWLQMRDKAIFSWSDEPGVGVRQHGTPRPVDPMVRYHCRESVALRYAPELDRRGRVYQSSRVAAGAVRAESVDVIQYAVRSLLEPPDPTCGEVGGPWLNAIATLVTALVVEMTRYSRWVGGRG